MCFPSPEFHLLSQERRAKGSAKIWEDTGPGQIQSVSAAAGA